MASSYKSIDNWQLDVFIGEKILAKLFRVSVPICRHTNWRWICRSRFRITEIQVSFGLDDIGKLVTCCFASLKGRLWRWDLHAHFRPEHVRLKDSFKAPVLTCGREKDSRPAQETNVCA